MAQPKAALSAYHQVMLRERLEEPNSPPIADVYDSIACSYTEQGKVSEAFEYLTKAAAIHRVHNPHRMGRTQAIYAMTLFRAGQPEEALAAL
jgi:tetratricopeptide (TPR) repeat protein